MLPSDFGCVLDSIISDISVLVPDKKLLGNDIAPGSVDQIVVLDQHYHWYSVAITTINTITGSYYQHTPYYQHYN